MPNPGRSTGPTESTEVGAIESWLERFLESYYRRHPVNATFIGVHHRDHELPDFSETAIDDFRDEIADLLATVPDPRGASVFEDRVDLRLACGALRLQDWELRSSQFHRGNPSTYTGEAVFGILSLFLTDFAPLEERARSCVSRLESFPTFFKVARQGLNRAPLAWTQRAVRECRAGSALIERGLDLVEGLVPAGGSSLKRARARAAEALAQFLSFLSSELSAAEVPVTGCGEEVLDLYLREGHFLGQSSREVLEYAQAQLELSRLRLAEECEPWGSIHRAQQTAASLHPTQEGYLATFDQLRSQVQCLAEEQALLTWPEFPIRFVPRPRWTREAAPGLYFLFYRSPAAFNRPSVHDFLVTPIDSDLTVEQQEDLLRSQNSSVIKLNHVIHHGSIGHHVQNWHAFRCASRIGRIAAVDCASRIALFCGGTMAEGWACYATDLMRAAGFLTPLEEAIEQQARVRMCARAIVDVKLHTGRFSLEDAVRFYAETAGMAPQAANAEAVKNSMFPGAALMYLMGVDQIHALRETIATREGPRFSLRSFHDRLLSYGSIPVSLIATEMKRLSGGYGQP